MENRALKRDSENAIAKMGDLIDDLIAEIESLESSIKELEAKIEEQDEELSNYKHEI